MLWNCSSSRISGPRRFGGRSRFGPQRSRRRLASDDASPSASVSSLLRTLSVGTACHSGACRVCARALVSRPWRRAPAPTSVHRSDRERGQPGVRPPDQAPFDRDPSRPAVAERLFRPLVAIILDKPPQSLLKRSISREARCNVFWWQPTCWRGPSGAARGAPLRPLRRFALRSECPRRRRAPT